MRIVVLLAFSMLTAFGQERAKNWNISVAFFAGSQVMDAASSRGLVEVNPVLGRGPFGGRQIGIKAGIGGGMILTELLLLRRHPETRRFWTWANYAAGAVTVSVAARNWAQSAE